MNGSTLLQQTLLGLIQGSTFILIAVGFTLVWGTLRLINFAQIALFTVGGFIFVGAYQAMGDSVTPWVAYVVAAVAALLAMGILGGLVALGTWYPIRTAPNFALLVASLAVFILIVNLVELLVTPRPVHVPNPLSDSLAVVDGVPISASAVALLAVGIVGTAVLAVGVRTTKYGRAVRAIADDPASARLLGLPYVRIVTLTFAIAAGFSGLAGAMVNAHYGEVIFNGGIHIGLSGFTAAVLGGMGSMWGAIVGSLALGLITSYAVTVLPSNWQDAVVFVVLILVLAIRPTGILRTRTADRA
jgi:branched-chain amino acid transport system permease protein